MIAARAFSWWKTGEGGCTSAGSPLGLSLAAHSHLRHGDKQVPRVAERDEKKDDYGRDEHEDERRDERRQQENAGADECQIGGGAQTEPQQQPGPIDPPSLAAL
jgi:hypothetical protein